MKKVHLLVGYTVPEHVQVFECGVYQKAGTLRVGTDDVSRVTCRRCLKQLAQRQGRRLPMPPRGGQVSLAPCPCANWFDQVKQGVDICKGCGWR